MRRFMFVYLKKCLVPRSVMMSKLLGNSREKATFSKLLRNVMTTRKLFRICVKKFISRNFCQHFFIFRFLIQAAAAKHGVIVSNDKFRDFLRDLSSNDFLQRQTITQRLLPFVYHEGIFMFPPDPYGRKGPSLDQLLSF